MPDLSVYNPEGSRIMSRELNDSPYHFDRNMARDPENIVTIFTVNTRAQYSASAGVMFAGRPKDKRYLKVGSINDPKYSVDDLSIEGSRNQKKVIPEDGQWMAMDWLNPDNVYNLDQNYTVPGQVDYSTDLLRRGLFFIVRPFNKAGGNVNDEPTEAEIKAAELRLRNRYTELTRLFTKTNQSAPKNIPNILSEEMIDALNYARMKTPYNTELAELVDCPNCGETKPANAKFHKSESLGVICIEPSPEGWRAAVEAGIKSKEDVPEQFRKPTK